MKPAYDLGHLTLVRGLRTQRRTGSGGGYPFAATAHAEHLSYIVDRVPQGTFKIRGRGSKR